MAYPTTIPAPNAFKQRTIKKKYKGESEAGYTMTSAKASLAKKEFELEYSNLTDAEQVILQAHFDSNSGSFSFTVPRAGGATYTVVYFEEELEFLYVPVDRWAASVILREV